MWFGCCKRLGIRVLLASIVSRILRKPLARCMHNDMPGRSPFAACLQPLCSEADGAVAPLPPTAEGTVVVGSLANSYATYQLRLSARLAREHHALRFVDRQLSQLGGQL